jgi:hypothetical protein
MADSVTSKKTSLPSEEVVIRAIQFFSTSNWQATSQGNRAVTLKGRVPIPFGLILLTVVGWMLCVVPGIILYFALIKKMRGFQNLVVTTHPTESGCEVAITYPPHARKLVGKFLATLPASP